MDAKVLAAWCAIGGAAITSASATQSATKLTDFAHTKTVPRGIAAEGILFADAVLHSAAVAAWAGAFLAAVGRQSRGNQVQRKSEDG